MAEDADPTVVRHDRRGMVGRRLTLFIAGALTIVMLGWQGWHIYESYRAVAHKESGKCATKLVEEAYFAATLHSNQIDDLEHGIAASTPIASIDGTRDWRQRFAASDVDLDAAIDAARAEVTAGLLAAVERVDVARRSLNTRADHLVSVLVTGDRDAAWDVINSAGYTADRREYSAAVAGLVSETRKHLEVQLGAERRSELLSVSVALGIFALALGAWGLFLRRIRKDQLRLATEARHRQRAEEELLQAQKLDAMGKMAGEIAHDFNNLVTAIWGSATAARDQLGDEHPALTSIRRIEEASEQANDVVSGLLAFGRQAPSHRDPIEVGALIWQTASLLQSMMPDSVELVIEAGQGGARWVSGDRTQLQQVLINLALNARDAMPEGGRITIRTRCSADPHTTTATACIEVIDTGHGMTPEVQSRIFEPFFTTRDGTRSGTGLGLAIVHGIVTNHGGHIRVDSERGGGSRFVVGLPMIAAPAESVVDQKGDTVRRPTGGATVLLTEDHRHVREIMTETLEDAGYTVVQAETGDELLETFRAAPDRFDLLVVDLDIPGPNGLTCLERLRNDGVRTPALLVTGTGAPDLEARIGALGAVLRKPFSMTVLRESVAEAITLTPAGHARG